MEIKPEFESELMLWNIREFVMDKRKFDECIPENLKENREYSFLLSGQKFFWLFGKFPLIEKSENEKVTPVTRALVNIYEITHFIEKEKVFTRGKYKIFRVMDKI